MNTDTRDPLRLIQSGLDKLGHSPGAIDGLWGPRTARAMKALLDVCRADCRRLIRAISYLYYRSAQRVRRSGQARSAWLARPHGAEQHLAGRAAHSRWRQKARG